MENLMKHKRFVLLMWVETVTVFLMTGCTPALQPGECAAVLSEKRLDLPVRPAAAPDGRAFVRMLDTLCFEARETRIVQEILSGNVPDFLRTFYRFSYEIDLPADDAGPADMHTVVFYALPDYLAVGSDADFIRMPMGPLAAQQIADSLFCSLPTAMLVDKIAAASQGAIEPFPFRPLGNRNEQPVVFEDSNHAIQALFEAKSYTPGQLISGLKKDVILSHRISDTSRADHVTLYGWHYPDGSCIQPVTNVHINRYVDYSHGIRLLYRMIEVDGNPFDLLELLQDGRMFRLVSDEDRPMEQPTYAGGRLHP